MAGAARRVKRLICRYKWLKLALDHAEWSVLVSGVKLRDKIEGSPRLRKLLAQPMVALWNGLGDFARQVQELLDKMSRDAETRANAWERWGEGRGGVV